MSDEQLIELAAKFGIGPNSGLGFARAIEQASRTPTCFKCGHATHDGSCVNVVPLEPTL